MFTVSIMEQFAAAHRLPDLGEGLHGHTYAVWVSVGRPGLDRQGIAYDFRILRQALRTVIQQLDHRYLNDLDFFSDKNPTAENIAVYIYEAFRRALPEPALQSVEVAESDRAKVTYEKDDRKS